MPDAKQHQFCCVRFFEGILLKPQFSDLPMGRAEFIALMAMMFATIAFSIDAMLPAIEEIGRELSPADPTRASLLVTSFVLGMGLGTFVSGPLSDAFGRRGMMFMGAALYIASATVAWASTSLEVMLIARLFQGIGASGPRVVSVAIIRDLFSGREMARILSIVMMIFTLFPAVAPAIGVVIMGFAGWRAIFLSFVVFSLISVAWLGLRLPETLPVADRRPLKWALIREAVQQMFAHPVVRLSIFAQTCAMASLFSLLMSIPVIYSQVFDRFDSFPFWFALTALISASASLLNAFLVVRFGMRRLVTLAFVIQIVMSAGLLVLNTMTDPVHHFTLFIVWQSYLFFQAGLTIGNLNAIAMEPMGHIAGMAASVIGAVATILAALVASPVGLMFDGTVRPVVIAVLVMVSIGLVLMLRMKRMEERIAAQ